MEGKKRWIINLYFPYWISLNKLWSSERRVFSLDLYISTYFHVELVGILSELMLEQRPFTCSTSYYTRIPWSAYKRRPTLVIKFSLNPEVERNKTDDATRSKERKKKVMKTK